MYNSRDMLYKVPNSTKTIFFLNFHIVSICNYVTICKKLWLDLGNSYLCKSNIYNTKCCKDNVKWTPRLTFNSVINSLWLSDAIWRNKSEPTIGEPMRPNVIYVNPMLSSLFTSPGRHLTYSVATHDDVIKWNPFPCYWPFVWGIHRSPLNHPHKC